MGTLDARSMAVGALLVWACCGAPAAGAAPPPPAEVRPQFVCRLVGEAMQTAGLAFSPDGRTLAASNGPDSRLRFWEVATRRVRIDLPNPRFNRGQHYVVYDRMAFLPDGRSMLAR